MAKNIAKQALNPIDKYLLFVQQNFNTSGGQTFKPILLQLESYARAGYSNSHIAQELHDELLDLPILSNIGKYKKFDKLGNFDLSDSGLRNVYKVSSDIINDINKSRAWIESYRRFSKTMQTINLKDLHSELIVLGKSILGRAIEMCPKDTGYLRSTGVLLDFGTYIIIAFLAPYATYVHENMDIVHPNHRQNSDCGGEAKFLEKAVQEAFPDRSVWVEHLGEGEVSVKISINPLLIEYTHYS